MCHVYARFFEEMISDWFKEKSSFRSRHRQRENEYEGLATKFLNVVNLSVKKLINVCN